MLRALAWTGNGLTGGASALVLQLAYWVPLGSPFYRGALAGTLLLAGASAAIYALTRTLLAQSAPRIAPVLALIAALTVSLSSAAQAEGEVGCGASLALLLSLLALRLLLRGPPQDPRAAAWLGLLLGGVLAERWTCFACLCAAATVAWRSTQGRPPFRATTSAALLGAATALLLWSPLALRPLALHPYLDLGPLRGDLASEVIRETASGVRMLHTDVGYVAFAAALAGAALGVWRRPLRQSAIALLVIVVLDALSSWTPMAPWGDLAALHLLAFSALAAAIALAVQSASVAITTLQLPMTRGAVVFMVMADLTLAVSSAEEAAYRRDDAAARGTAAVTREALTRLPQGAVLLARSSAMVLRALTARLIEGERPDVLLLASPLTAEPRYAAALLEREPALQQVLRDAALEGYPREEALTIAADARPMLSELDRGWDRRTVSHLLPDRLWLRFLPQPLGASDRRPRYADLRATADAVAKESRDNDRLERATAALLRSRLVDAAVLGVALGDRDEMPALTQAIGQLVPDDPFVRELNARLAAGKGAIDWKGLPR